MASDKKVAFIICANNELYYEECQWYLNQLCVPEGYETDIICITEAESMAAAYNAAMQNIRFTCIRMFLSIIKTLLWI